MEISLSPNEPEFSDPGFGCSTCDPATEETFNATIDWGDGTVETDQDLNVDITSTPGSPGIPTTGTVTGTHNFGLGLFRGSVSVEDDDQGASSDGLLVIVAQFLFDVAAQAPAQLSEGTPVDFDGTVGLPVEIEDISDVSNVRYFLDFGDGSELVIETPDLALQAPTSTHVFADNGIYTVTLTVVGDVVARDEQGDIIFDDGNPLIIPDAAAGSSSVEVVVANEDPVVAEPTTALGQVALFEGDSITLNADFTDLGFDNPGSVPPTEETFTATIDWDDGSPIEAVTPTFTSGDWTDAERTASDPSAGIVTGAHVYADNGTYDVVVCVSDDDAGEACKTITIEVDNATPTIDAGQNQNAFIGQTVLLDPATFNDKGTLDTHTATIDWGDTTPTDAGTVDETPFGPPGSTDGLDGTVAGSHVYSTTSDPDQPFVVTVEVTDDEDASGSDSFEVAVEKVLTLSLEPDEEVAAFRGEQFGVAIRVNAGKQPVDNVTVTLDFDSNFLEIGSVTPGPLGAVFPVEVTVGNSTVTITGSGAPVSLDDFVLATVNFRPIAPTSDPITVAFTGDNDATINIAGVGDVSVLKELPVDEVAVSIGQARFRLTDFVLDPNDELERENGVPAVNAGEVVPGTFRIENTSDDDATFDVDVFIDLNNADVPLFSHTQRVLVGAGATRVVDTEDIFSIVPEFHTVRLDRGIPDPNAQVPDEEAYEVDTFFVRPAEFVMRSFFLSPRNVGEGDTTFLAMDVGNEGGSFGELGVNVAVAGGTALPESDIVPLVPGAQTSFFFLFSSEPGSREVTITFDTLVNDLANEDVPEGQKILQRVETFNVIGPAPIDVDALTAPNGASATPSDLGADDPNVGRVGGALVAPNVVPGPDPEVEVAITRALSDSNQSGFEILGREANGSIGNIGAAMEINHNLDDVGPATISFTIGRLWILEFAINEDGVLDPSRIVIVRVDQGVRSILTTTCFDINGDPLVFGTDPALVADPTGCERFSPLGFSIFSLLTLVPIPETFNIGSLVVDPPVAQPGESVKITANVENAGEAGGSLSVLLRVSDPNGALPDGQAQQVRKIQSVTLNPDESQTVTFFLNPNPPKDVLGDSP